MDITSNIFYRCTATFPNALYIAFNSAVNTESVPLEKQNASITLLLYILLTTVSILKCPCKVPDIFCSVLNKFGFFPTDFHKNSPPHQKKKIESTKILPVFGPNLHMWAGRMTNKKKLIVLKVKYFAISCSRISQASTNSIEN